MTRMKNSQVLPLLISLMLSNLFFPSTLSSQSSMINEIIKKFVEDVITVSEEEIAYAMRLIWERMKIIIEPSSAVAIAAVIKDKTRLENKNVGIIITGGNVDLNALPF